MVLKGSRRGEKDYREDRSGTDKNNKKDTDVTGKRMTAFSRMIPNVVKPCSEKRKAHSIIILVWNSMLGREGYKRMLKVLLCLEL